MDCPSSLLSYSDECQTAGGSWTVGVKKSPVSVSYSLTPASSFPINVLCKLKKTKACFPLMQCFFSGPVHTSVCPIALILLQSFQNSNKVVPRSLFCAALSIYQVIRLNSFLKQKTLICHHFSSGSPSSSWHASSRPLAFSFTLHHRALLSWIYILHLYPLMCTLTSSWHQDLQIHPQSQDHVHLWTQGTGQWRTLPEHFPQEHEHVAERVR